MIETYLNPLIGHENEDFGMAYFLYFMSSKHFART